MNRPRKDDAWAGMGTGWSITAHLVGGIVTVGGLGYLLDRILGTGSVLTAVGIVAGGAVGIYIVYLRYGKGGE
jgi:F0F1-type ATP synthase assembly protein I